MSNQNLDLGFRVFRLASSNMKDVYYNPADTQQSFIDTFADNIKAMGFKNAAKSGISIGKDDFVIPAEKKKLLAATEAKVNEFEQQYQNGLITRLEKYNKVVDAWASCTDAVAKAMMKNISKAEPGQPVNSVYIMSDSGARGSTTQIRQLAGMRGLMAKPSGEIIETPIRSNFKEGLTVLSAWRSGRMLQNVMAISNSKKISGMKCSRQQQKPKRQKELGM